MIRLAITTLLCVAFGGCAVSDGPFEQVSGRPMDYEAIDQLAVKKATLSEVLAALGTPTLRETSLDGSEVLQYFSVKQRTSSKKTFGIRHGHSAQIMEERVSLIFKQGVLLETSKQSEVRETDSKAP